MVIKNESLHQNVMDKDKEIEEAEKEYQKGVEADKRDQLSKKDKDK